jgi:hypothetical protein
MLSLSNGVHHPCTKTAFFESQSNGGQKTDTKKMHFYEFGQLYGLSYPVYGGLGHLGNWAGARLCLIRSEIFLPFYDGSRIF